MKNEKNIEEIRDEIVKALADFINKPIAISAMQIFKTIVLTLIEKAYYFGNNLDFKYRYDEEKEEIIIIPQNLASVVCLFGFEIVNDVLPKVGEYTTSDGMTFIYRADGSYGFIPVRPVEHITTSLTFDKPINLN